MARRNRQRANESQLKFYQKLLLNRYLLSQFSVSSFKELAAELKKPAFEEIDNEGVTGFTNKSFPNSARNAKSLRKSWRNMILI